MKIVTFNIRCDYSQDGKNNFSNRKLLIKEKINQEQPDILCFQEVVPHVAKWFEKELSEYYIIGVGREADLTGEQVPIAYKKELFHLLYYETFWLSDTPYVPGSRYRIQSNCPRTCTVAVLQENGSTSALGAKKAFAILNLHLDHESVFARSEGIKAILAKISEDVRIKDIPKIILGDFNAIPESEEMKPLIKHEELMDVTKEINRTFHDYNRMPNPEKIDYIFTSRNLSCESAYAWHTCNEGVYLSDHDPVCAMIRLC